MMMMMMMMVKMMMVKRDGDLAQGTVTVTVTTVIVRHSDGCPSLQMYHLECGKIVCGEL
jgi:hypothetical protein